VLAQVKAVSRSFAIALFHAESAWDSNGCSEVKDAQLIAKVVAAKVRQARSKLDACRAVGAQSLPFAAPSSPRQRSALAPQFDIRGALGSRNQERR
jgi:hypothetical protein